MRTPPIAIVSGDDAVGAILIAGIFVANRLSARFFCSGLLDGVPGLGKATGSSTLPHSSGLYRAGMPDDVLCHDFNN